MKEKKLPDNYKEKATKSKKKAKSGETAEWDHIMERIQKLKAR